MNPAQLLTYFERISKAPDAILRLRRFILDLAVRGKLVEQQPNDEPAVELVKRIQTEKKRLIKEGKIRNQEPWELNGETEAPFKVPSTWEWVPATFPAYPVSDMGKKVQMKDVLESGEFPVVDQGKVFVRGHCNDRSKVIRVESPLVLFGDHTRETKLIDFDFIVGADGVKLLHPICLLTDYYYLALRWLPLDSRGYGRHYKLLKAALIPLPPLAEQHRIVAKVDELRALCDRLETMQAKRESRRDSLVGASLNRLNNGNDSESFREYARFHLNNFPRLTTRPAHVQQLRQAILNLAIRGQLVPQDQNDEPASELLKRIKAEKARLIKEGTLRKEKPLPSVTEHEAPFAIPTRWSWARIGTCSLFTEYGTSVKSDHTVSGVPVLKMGDIQGGQLILGGQKKVPRQIKDLPQLFLKRRDLLYNRTNSAELVGKTGIYLGDDDAYTFASYLIRIRLHNDLTSPFYLNLAMNAPYFRETQILPELKQQCGQANVNGTKLRNMIFPLPPLAEQHRIVAKVEELLTLCDRLETQLTNAHTESCRLLEAILQEALTPDMEKGEGTSTKKH